MRFNLDQLRGFVREFAHSSEVSDLRELAWHYLRFSFGQLRDIAYVCLATVAGVMLNFIELFILQPPEPESVWSVQYELFVAAFGILWTAHHTVPDYLLRTIFQPMAFVGIGLLVSFLSMGLASPVEGLPWPVGWSFARNHDFWFTIVVPDVIAAGVLLWAIVVARRVWIEEWY
jgi:hypothetical protein